jgi:hypothetical protein
VSAVGKAFAFLAKPQRDGQELFRGHAFAAEVIPEPCLGSVAFVTLGQGLATSWQVVECIAFLGLGYLSVDSRGEAHASRLAVGHAPALVSHLLTCSRLGEPGRGRPLRLGAGSSVPVTACCLVKRRRTMVTACTLTPDAG